MPSSLCGSRRYHGRVRRLHPRAHELRDRLAREESRHESRLGRLYSDDSRARDAGARAARVGEGDAREQSPGVEAAPEAGSDEPASTPTPGVGGALGLLELGVTELGPLDGLQRVGSLMIGGNTGNDNTASTCGP
jgi:hypothetical protein